MSEEHSAPASANDGDATIWEVLSAGALRWRQWDSEFVVYNPASGLTHHLNFLAGEALSSLDALPASTYQLRLRLSEQLGIAQDSPPLQMIEPLIRQFDELGLIVPSPR